MNNFAQSILVSYTRGNDTDKSLMLVGQKQAGKDIVIVNAFQDKEADELWKTLTTKKKGKIDGKESK